MRVLASITTPLKMPFRRVREIWRRVFIPRLETLPIAPDLFAFYRSLSEHPALERKPGGWLYQDRFYPDYLTVGGASHAIFPVALNKCRGQGVDIGAGLWPLPGATPVDSGRGPGVAKHIAHFEDGSLDFVFSSHCLEHIENWRGALREWVDKLKPGGTLFLYLPHPDCAIWRPGSPIVGDGHKWIPKPEIVKQTLQELGCEIEYLTHDPDAMQSFAVCGRKRGGPQR